MYLYIYRILSRSEIRWMSILSGETRKWFEQLTVEAVDVRIPLVSYDAVQFCRYVNAFRKNVSCLA
jgi:hypothetical protein